MNFARYRPCSLGLATAIAFILVPLPTHGFDEQTPELPDYSLLEEARKVLVGETARSANSVESNPRSGNLIALLPETDQSTKKMLLGFNPAVGETHFLSLPWNMTDIAPYWHYWQKGMESDEPLPYDNIDRVSRLVDLVLGAENVDVVVAHDRSNDKLLSYYSTAEGSWAGEDFGLIPGEALLIGFREQKSGIVYGTHLDAHFELLPLRGGNWVSLPYHARAATAWEVLKEVEEATAVAFWNDDDREFEIYPRTSGKRVLKKLAIQPGVGCILFVDEATEWAPALY